MCGIVGFLPASVGHVNGTKAFMNLLVMDSLRGEDSTGIIFGDRRGKVEYIKDILAGYDFVNDRRVRKKIETRTNAFLIGHNRYGTMGSSWDVENAHPFRHGNVTMVHNGTLYNHEELQSGNAFEVDSEAVCHSLNFAGYDETIKTIEGAFTLVWYNKASKRVCMVRNDERPLWLATSVAGIHFASEKHMLLAALERNKIAPIKVEELPVGELWQFDITSHKLPVSTRKMELAPEPIINYYNRGGYSKKPMTPHMGSGKTSSSTDSKVPSIASGQVVCCSICSDYTPRVTSFLVRGSADEFVCNDCDDLYYDWSGHPVNYGAGANLNLPPIERDS